MPDIEGAPVRADRHHRRPASQPAFRTVRFSAGRCRHQSRRPRSCCCPAGRHRGRMASVILRWSRFRARLSPHSTTMPSKTKTGTRRAAGLGCLRAKNEGWRCCRPKSIDRKELRQRAARFWQREISSHALGTTARSRRLLPRQLGSRAPLRRRGNSEPARRTAPASPVRDCARNPRSSRGPRAAWPAGRSLRHLSGVIASSWPQTSRVGVRTAGQKMPQCQAVHVGLPRDPAGHLAMLLDEVGFFRRPLLAVIAHEFRAILRVGGRRAAIPSGPIRENSRRSRPGRA